MFDTSQYSGDSAHGAGSRMCRYEVFVFDFCAWDADANWTFRLVEEMVFKHYRYL